jgi:hypothetical protein
MKIGFVGTGEITLAMPKGAQSRESKDRQVSN